MPSSPLSLALGLLSLALVVAELLLAVAWPVDYLARTAGLDALDLLEAFAARELAAVQQGARDPHPTPLGPRVAAAAILELLHRDYAGLLSRAPR